MTSITVSLSGFDEARKRFANADSVLEDELMRAAQEAVLLLEADMRRRVPQDTRELMRSIASDVDPIGGGVRGIVRVGAPYGEVVELGRRPGRMPPPDELRGWARRHGIPETALFPLARAIGRKGIQPRPFFRPAIEANGDRIVELINGAVNKAISRLEGRS